jgi:hypothetical protein
MKAKTKHCNACNKDKSIKEFNKHFGKKDGLRYTCKVCRHEYDKKLNKKLKLAVIKEYGGKCVCCGELEPDFLTIDHIDENGAEERRTKKQTKIYRWLKNNGYPKDNYQLLCWNCNCASYLCGICPHKKSQ